PLPEGAPPVTFNLFGEARIYAGDQGSPGSHETMLNTVGQPQFGFQLANLDLFAVARLGHSFLVLAEVVMELPGINEFELDVERLQLTYKLNDLLTVTLGRVHAFMGYYNTAFHHGAWLETPLGRPRVIAFEDHGGLVPVHLVGLEAGGHLLRRGI